MKIEDLQNEELLLIKKSDLEWVLAQRTWTDILVALGSLKRRSLRFVMPTHTETSITEEAIRHYIHQLNEDK